MQGPNILVALSIFEYYYYYYSIYYNYIPYNTAKGLLLIEHYTAKLVDYSAFMQLLLMGVAHC